MLSVEATSFRGVSVEADSFKAVSTDADGINVKAGESKRAGTITSCEDVAIALDTQSFETLEDDRRDLTVTV